MSDTTRQRYRAAVKPFVEWMLDYGLVPVMAEEYDDLLVEFKNSEEGSLTRSQFTKLVSAIEWVFPHFKGRLSWSHAVLAGWQTGESTRHTVPLSVHQAVLVAVHLCSRGLARLAVALLLQCELGLRSCELLALRKEDISLPARLGGPQHQHHFVLGLGIKAGTKAKRAQYVVLRQESEPVFSLLVRLIIATPAGLLFPYSHAYVSKWLKVAECDIGCQAGWTPHSGRAGFATDKVTEGWNFVQIKEVGRWVSDSSLRCYIDLVTAASIADRWRLAGLEPAAKLARERLLDYFPVGCFGQEYGAEGLPQGRQRDLDATVRAVPEEEEGGFAGASAGLDTSQEQQGPAVGDRGAAARRRARGRGTRAGASAAGRGAGRVGPGGRASAGRGAGRA